MHSTVISETKLSSLSPRSLQPTLGKTGRLCKLAQDDHVTYDERCENMLLRECDHPRWGRSEEAAWSRKSLNLTLKEV